MKEVDYLIIGAGMAGLVLRHFLENDNTVLLDPHPGGYKIGESVVPEHYGHADLKALLPKVQQLPSYSPKMGSLFISGNSAAAYTLPQADQFMAMHVSRDEVEPLMAQEWGIHITKESVKEIDLASKTVKTDQNTYKVRHQILDCSGPAMVTARLTGNIQELWPVFATWGYFDIEESDDSRYWQKFREQDGHYARFDLPLGRLLAQEAAPADYALDRLTVLSQIRQGVWTWQIPMFDRTRLSFGVVSKHGPVSEEEFFATAREHLTANYVVTPRPLDQSSPYNRLHRRNRFARIAEKPATMDYILLADAFAFADPIYSVGTALAVNKGLEVARLLNENGWTPALCDQFNQNYTALIDRAVKAFDFWYTNDLLTSDEAAREVQSNFLRGNAFQVDISKHYGQMLVDTKLSADKFTPATLAPDEALTAQAATLLGVALGQTRHGWVFHGAVRGGEGVLLRFEHPAHPLFVLRVWPQDHREGCYASQDGLAVGYLNIQDKPYPMTPDSQQLLSDVWGKILAESAAWLKVSA